MIRGTAFLNTVRTVLIRNVKCFYYAIFFSIYLRYYLSLFLFAARERVEGGFDVSS